jgi:hypothetical protein
MKKTVSNVQFLVEAEPGVEHGDEIVRKTSFRLRRGIGQEVVTNPQAIVVGVDVDIVPGGVPRDQRRDIPLYGLRPSGVLDETGIFFEGAILQLQKMLQFGRREPSTSGGRVDGQFLMNPPRCDLSIM